MSIPIELLSMFGGAVTGAVFKFIGMSMENKKLQTELMIDRVKVEHDIRKDIMEGPKRGNRGFQWTKRIIALSTVFAVIILPKLAAVIDPSITIAYGNIVEGTNFLWFTTATSIDWVVGKGLIITPVDIHATLAVFSMYMGSSIMAGRNG